MLSTNAILTKQLNSICLFLFSVILITSCKKDIHEKQFDNDEITARANNIHGHLKQTKTYSSDVVQTWINFDLRLLRTNPINNFLMVQQWAYSSIALYEALVPGMPAYQSLSGQLNQMPSMPATIPGMAYHWPTAANTVLAEMKRQFYTNVTAADKVSTDSLEAALNAAYQNEVNAETFQRSIEFGKAVANKVYDWAKTDGSLTVHPPYILPVGDGQWEKTFPAFANPQNPYWSTNRPLMAGSVAASAIPPPPAFSTDPTSPFFAMAKEVYDISKALTPQQKEQVIAWRDVPGGGHAHWLDIFNQVMKAEGDDVMLDRAALIYVKLGISQSDARISCWKAKYEYNLLRPITYLRNVMGYTDWNSFITTPNHPEYPSAHSSFSVPAAIVLSKEFGNNYSFTDHTYNFLGLPTRYYYSFMHAAEDAGDSRVYAGLHFRTAIDAGTQLGTAIEKYMSEQIRFLK
jgi:hypothetical protein